MIHFLIMAGGKGTRFWPLSRERKAKQFLSMIGTKSLIEYTIDRLSGIDTESQTWILGNQHQSEHLDKLTSIVPNERILREPFG